MKHLMTVTGVLLSIILLVACGGSASDSNPPDGDSASDGDTQTDSDDLNDDADGGAEGNDSLDGDADGGAEGNDSLDGDSHGDDPTDGDDTVCTGCLIDLICYENDALNPNNPCEVCSAVNAVSEWSRRSIGSLCDDGAICTHTDVCTETGVCAGMIYSCDNPGACETAAGAICLGDGTCDYPADLGAICDDGDACTHTDVCQADKACQGLTYSCDNPGFCETPTGALCLGDGTCDYPADLGAICDDGDDCTHADLCQADTSCVGTAYSCTAGECEQTSACDGLGGCHVTSKINGAVCGEGDLNQCVAGSCVDCFDVTGCNDLSWGGRTAECAERICKSGHVCELNNAPSGTFCGLNDHNQCNGMGFCVDCVDTDGCGDLSDDDNSCTNKACSNYICLHQSNDENQCSIYPCTNDFCLSGQCQIGSPTTGCLIDGVCLEEGDSKDNDGCMACDPDTSSTTWTHMDGAVCAETDDGNPCTDNICSGGVCIVKNNNMNFCTDAHSCTNTACSGGNCVVTGTSAGCYITDVCYAQDTLKGATGNDSCRICSNATAWNGWTALESGSCDDGDLCTINDACRPGGACVGTPNTCSGHGTCNPTDGSCECANPHMTADCSSCLPHFTGYPNCSWDGSFPDGYCVYNSCSPVLPTGASLCYDETDAIACPTGVPAACNLSAPEDFCGQDAQYPGKDRIFTCYEANGAIQTPCAATTSPGEYVKDSLSGLIWQRHLPTTYDGCTLGSPAGARCSWEEALEYCKDLVIGGLQDWRAPSPHELTGIFDLSRYDPAIDPDAFPMETVNLWIGAPYVGSQTQAWSINSYNAMTSGANRTSAYKVRCVHGGALTEGSSDFERFETSSRAGQTVVRDVVSGLTWQGVYTTSKTWRQALSYCEGLDYGGHNDWRLPDLNEMQTLVDYSRMQPASRFPDPTQLNFWVSTSVSFLPARALAIGFMLGASFSWEKTSAMNVRCVRDTDTI